MKKMHTKTMKMTVVATMLLHSRKDPYSICWSSNSSCLWYCQNKQFPKSTTRAKAQRYHEMPNQELYYCPMALTNAGAMHNNLVFCVVHLNKRLSKLPSTTCWNLANQIKTKAPQKKKKREYKEQNGKTHVQERRQKNHLRGQTTRGTSSFQTPSSRKKHIIKFPNSL
jgi:hypothetical protein